jgi:hypothetical protein
MTIKFTKPKNISALLARAKKDADKHGITYEGDINSGHGSGMGFEGSYTVNADFITIHVKKKPLLVSKARIEAEVKKYISLES